DGLQIWAHFELKMNGSLNWRRHQKTLVDREFKSPSPHHSFSLLLEIGAFNTLEPEENDEIQSSNDEKPLRPTFDDRIQPHLCYEQLQCCLILI
ncbi:MAG: hypothetical protein ACW99U_18775, partial [Candidatus Thorarchaeota archaeon]